MSDTAAEIKKLKKKNL